MIPGQPGLAFVFVLATEVGESLLAFFVFFCTGVHTGEFEAGLMVLKKVALEIVHIAAAFFCPP